MVDDYLGTKALQHVANAELSVDITIISDNKGNSPLRLTEYNDFLTEYPGRVIRFVSSAGKTHDRYVVLDYGTSSMKVYHCGASSKDAGNRITTITRLNDIDGYEAMMSSLLSNPVLNLK